MMRLATSFAARTKGLLFAKEGSDVLLIAPCKDIHTVGMRRSIDVAFVDESGCVLDSVRNLSPMHRKRVRGASAVIERFSCDDPWPKPGDRIRLSSRGVDAREAVSDSSFSLGHAGACT